MELFIGMGFYSAVLIIVVSSCVQLLFNRRESTRLPPAPKPWPIVGNLTDLPRRGVPEYQHWLTHKDRFGALSSVRAMGQTMLLIHDRDIAIELLEKQSKKTSGRPPMEFANHLCGYSRFFSTRPHDNVHRRSRRLVHQRIGTKKLAERHYQVHAAEVGHFLLKLLEEPNKLVEHLKSQSGAIILKVAYNYSVEQKVVDPLVLLIERMMENFSVAVVPGAWLVDLIPVFRYLPQWLPGASFKRMAKEADRINQMAVEIPYSFVRRQMELGSYQSSYVSEAIESCTNGSPEAVLHHEDDDAIKNSAGALYGGGADTTVASLCSFVLAMLKFPDVQRMAQEEIDNLVGDSRLPQFEDRHKLPFVEATVKETLRWFAITPMGLPHSADEDIEIRGYHVPKGTILLPAIWWFLHDPDIYANPDSFDPTRYLSPRNEPDPGAFAFGFGRRVCPGRHLADSTLFLTIAQLLAAFKVEKATDKDGNPIDPPVESISGLINHPKSFPYNITPRSPTHADLIRRIEMEYPWQQSNAEELGDLSPMKQALAVPQMR